MNKRNLMVGLLVVVVLLVAGGAFYVMTNDGHEVYADVKVETIEFESVDGLLITADVRCIDNFSPMILLFHQAHSSRGEYAEIAPKLNELGYNTMAVDQRSGFTNSGIDNETVKRARDEGYTRSYFEAIKDVNSTIEYAVNTLGYEEVLTWGSSYSSAIVLARSYAYPDNIIGVLSFSPGEYTRVDDASIGEGASKLNIPVFITGKKAESAQLERLYGLAPAEKKMLFIPEGEGIHGSKTLWESSVDHEEYWVAVTKFLTEVIQPSK